jgi:YVTN family beta-propeller protein
MTGHIRNVEKVSRAFLGLVAISILAECGGSLSAVNSQSNGGGRGGPVAANVTGTISVGITPRAVAVDSTNNKIYVADFGTPQPAGIHGVCTQSGADVRAIDGATQATTSVGFLWPSLNPYAAAMDPASHTFYVLAKVFATGFSKSCFLFTDGIEVFDATSSLTQTKNASWYPGGQYRNAISVNSTTGNIYVASPLNGGVVYVLDSSLSTGPVATISVGSNPAGIAVSPATNKIYVANSASNSISVIDGASNSVVATITDPNSVAPVGVAVNPTTNVIYVTNAASDNLTEIDGVTDTVTATVPVGTSPSGVDVDCQTNFIYVANAGNPQAGDAGSVTVINGVTNATTALTDPKAKSPVAIAVNSITNKIYAANSVSNNIMVIDGAHN